MKLIYDGHIFRWQKVGGIGRYFREIIQRLPTSWHPSILGIDAHSELPSHPNISTSQLSTLRPRKLTQPLQSAYWRHRLKDPNSLLHPTYYCLSGGLRYSAIRSPIVITVHDLICARYRDLESDGSTTFEAMRRAVDAADQVVCVSRCTEQHLIESLPHAAGKTRVIYHGSSFPIMQETPTDTIFRTPSFLFVGRRATYKNFNFVLRAFAKACHSHPTIRLCTAGSPLSEEERWSMHFLGIRDRVDSVVHPDENGLRGLYRRSVALVYPSRHEGFGIPPLEAMACGTLAITSNATSLPEVVGDAGILLDPTDEDCWADCMLAVANQRVPRERLLSKGRMQAARLTWDESGRQHVELYRQIVGALQ